MTEIAQDPTITCALGGVFPAPDKHAGTPYVCPVCWEVNRGCRLGDTFACTARPKGGSTHTTIEGGVCYAHYPRVPSDLCRFIQAIFFPDDKVLLRQIETWTEKGDRTRKRSQSITRPGRIEHRRAAVLTRIASIWEGECSLAERTFGNQFFGVAPRPHAAGVIWPRGTWDLAAQIRRVNTLWADIDGCDAAAALARCAAAGLPCPTVAVASGGGGSHLYWRLSSAYLIDDVGEPPPLVRDHFIHEDQADLGPYLLLPDGERVYGPFNLSPKAQKFQALLAWLADTLGGDHTTDLSRLLRLPTTLHRKNQRNGREPTLCELVECDPTRRYSFASFEELRGATPLFDVRPVPAAGDSADSPLPLVWPASTPSVSHASATCRATEADDDALLAQMFAARNGAAVRALWEGDLSAHGGDHSRADFALLCHLAFWTNRDAARMGRLFSRSKLGSRPKWNRARYQARSISRAIACSESHAGDMTESQVAAALAQLEDLDLPGDDA